MVSYFSAAEKMAQSRHPPTGGGKALPEPTDAEEAFYMMREGDPTITGLKGFESETGNSFFTGTIHRYIMFAYATLIPVSIHISHIHIWYRTGLLT
jgi:hypothetical protein